MGVLVLHELELSPAQFRQTAPRLQPNRKPDPGKTTFEKDLERSSDYSTTG